MLSFTNLTLEWQNLVSRRLHFIYITSGAGGFNILSKNTFTYYLSLSLSLSFFKQSFNIRTVLLGEEILQGLTF